MEPGVSAIPAIASLVSRPPFDNMMTLRVSSLSARGLTSVPAPATGDALGLQLGGATAVSEGVAIPGISTMVQVAQERSNVTCLAFGCVTWV